MPIQIGLDVIFTNNDICTTTTNDNEEDFRPQSGCYSLEYYIPSCSVHKECKTNTRNSTDACCYFEREIHGLITALKGKEALEVKYREKGIIQTGIFKFRQMRKPRSKPEYLIDSINYSSTKIAKPSVSDTKGDTKDKEEDPDSDEYEEAPPNIFQMQRKNPTMTVSHNSVNTMFWAENLELKDERYGRNMKYN